MILVVKKTQWIEMAMARETVPYIVPCSIPIRPGVIGMLIK